jgi:hypothetical protein
LPMITLIFSQGDFCATAACHPQRAHPKRDRLTGRTQLGLAPYFENDDMIEFAEAA